MKTITSYLSISLTALLLLMCRTSGAADWDDGFSDSFMENVAEGFVGGEIVTCVATLGTDVYVGVQEASGGTGRVWRYKESDGSWAEIAYVGSGTNTLRWGVLALSAVEDDDGTKYLCVGGDFRDITYGAASTNVYNVAILNLTSGTISRLQAFGASTYGTDGTVYALKALPWVGGFLGTGIKVLVGGEFANAGSVSSQSIALWSDFSLDSWSGFSGGFTDDGVSDRGIVYAIEATTTESFGNTAFDNVWLTGSFRRAFGATNMLNIAKLSGSGNTWTYLGEGFQGIGIVPGTCDLATFVYLPLFGQSIARVGSTVYIGGAGTAHVKAEGTLFYCPVECQGCPTCPGAQTGLMSLGTSSALISPTCEIFSVRALATKGSDLYASGSLWTDENLDPVYFGKLSSGVWTAIPKPSGIIGNFAVAAASTSSHVYFVSDYCWRYTP